MPLPFRPPVRDETIGQTSGAGKRPARVDPLRTLPRSCYNRQERPACTGRHRESALRAPTDAPPLATERRGWDAAVRPLVVGGDGQLWRAHSDAINGALVARWLDPAMQARVLKTDLFDEAMGVGLAPLLGTRAHRDRRDRHRAFGVARRGHTLSRSRHRRGRRSDSCRSPTRRSTRWSRTPRSIISARATTSARRWRVFHRVLRPGGRLVLTMDNLRHPAVALRNAIPAGWLKRSGLVPYPVGATLGPRGLARMVRAAGFDVVEMDALLHCPRALAVRRARTLERFGTSARSDVSSSGWAAGSDWRGSRCASSPATMSASSRKRHDGPPVARTRPWRRAMTR